MRDSDVVFLVPDLEPDVYVPKGGAWDLVPRDQMTVARQ